MLLKRSIKNTPQADEFLLGVFLCVGEKVYKILKFAINPNINLH